MIGESEAQRLAALAYKRVGICSEGYSSIEKDFIGGKESIEKGLSLRMMPRQQLDFNKLAAWENAIVNVTANISSQAISVLPDNGVFIDVGANTGLFTSQVTLHKPEAKGYLFEPVPEYAQCCEERFRGYTNLTIENLALSDKEGSLTLWMGKENLGWNTVVAPKIDSSMTPIQIKAVTFDEYAEAVGIDEIDVIKIDVEGAEYLVIEGMKRTLARLNKKPIILCEIGWGCNSHPEWEREKAVFEWLFDNGYERFNYNVESTSDVVFVPKKKVEISVASDLKKNKLTPRVTIGIPTRDRPEDLIVLLKSIEGQSYPNFEILISDDGSKYDIRAEIKNALPNLKYAYVRGPGISLPSNRQNIIENAKTELVVMCDDDHLMDVMCVEELVNTILTDESIGIVSAIWPTGNEEIKVVEYEEVKDAFEFNCSIKEINEDSDFWWKNGCDLFKAIQKDPTPQELELAGGGCLIYRKRVVQEVGGFPLDYSRVSFREDTDMSHRVYLAGYKVLLNTRAVAMHFFAPLGGCREDDDWAVNFVSDGKRFLKKLSWWRTCKAQLEELNQRFGRIKVLTFYDEVGWAWWHRAHNLKKNLPQVEIDIKKIGSEFREEDYDFILLFDAYLLSSLGQVDPGKLIVSNSCPKLLQDTVNVISEERAVASVINNWDAYRQVSSDDRFFCCQNGVDTELFYPSTDRPSEFTACWVGNSLSLGEKGLDIIEEACRQAGVKLILADASKLPKVSDAMSQEKLRDNFYHKASVLICASKFEGTPNPALEALACGLPVISTRVGNMTELIQDGYNGFLVERSVKSIKDALILLRASDQDLLTRGARESVELGWGWGERSRLYLSMFEELRRRRYFGKAPSFEVSYSDALRIAKERSLADLPRPLFSAFVKKEEGKFVELDRCLLDWCSDRDKIIKSFSIFTAIPEMYLHFGGIGDAVLLLSTFYDSSPEQNIFSVSTNISASKAFFSNFPKLKKIYLMELGEDVTQIQVFLYLQAQFQNCLGRGATPLTTHQGEWVAGIDPFKTYGISQSPRWPLNFKPEILGKNQVVLAPCGSMMTMAEGKRNIIDPRIWPELQGYLLDLGCTPVVVGLPKEDRLYPLLPGVINARGFDPGRHMRLMRGAEMLIGADSWAKSFFALLGKPTIVFAPMYNGVHSRDFVDASANIFLKPWRNINVVYGLEEIKFLLEGNNQNQVRLGSL